VSGAVLVQLPGTTNFVPIERTGEVLPVGTIVDARKGRVRLTASLGKGKGVGVADFFEGVFKITQKSTGKGVTELTLVGGSFKNCPGPGGKSAQAAGKLKKTKSIRHLWGEGKGLFRTKGRYAAATLRGTKWLTDDRCDGTLIRVAIGAVSVTDLPKKKTLVLKAPKSYLAKAR
jgi:hypothetical protein